MWYIFSVFKCTQQKQNSWRSGLDAWYWSVFLYLVTCLRRYKKQERAWVAQGRSGHSGLEVVDRANRAHICRSENLFGNFRLPFTEVPFFCKVSLFFFASLQIRLSFTFWNQHISFENFVRFALLQKSFVFLGTSSQGKPN